MTGNSLFINGSSHITLSNSKLKSTADGQVPHNADGFYAVNSAYLSIGGVPACPKSMICNSFDYDTGWGVYLQNTHDVTITTHRRMPTTPGRSCSTTPGT